MSTPTREAQDSPEALLALIREIAEAPTVADAARAVAMLQERRDSVAALLDAQAQAAPRDPRPTQAQIEALPIFGRWRGAHAEWLRRADVLALYAAQPSAAPAPRAPQEDTQ